MRSRRAKIARSVVAALSAVVTLAPLLAAQVTATAAPHHVAGDFDGDGRVDLAVGAPGANRVRVTYTKVHPHGSHVAYLHSSLPSLYSMRFGASLAVGDFNGDGRSDLAVSAPDYTTAPVGDGVTETRGGIFVYFGSSTGLRAQPLRLVGPYDGDEPYNLGTDLAAADVNGDGYTDLAATLLGIDDGNIRVYSGSAAGLTAAGYQPLDDYEATSLAFGDVDGDHHLDLVAASTVDLGNPTDVFYGDVMIFHGTASGLRSSSPQKIRGDEVGIFRDFGTAVAVGDLNGDGYADVVVGAAYDRSEPTHPSPGTIVVLTGSASGLAASRHRTISESAVYSGAHDGNGFGDALAIAKITSDRYADVVVGAPTERVGGKPGAGAIYLLRGSAHGLSLAHVQRFTAGTPGVPGAVSKNARFGAALFLTRLNADSRPDLVVGAPGKTYGATKSGMYVTMRGTATGITASHAHGVGTGLAHAALGSSLR